MVVEITVKTNGIGSVKVGGTVNTLNDVAQFLMKARNRIIAIQRVLPDARQARVERVSIGPGQ